MQMYGDRLRQARILRQLSGIELASKLSLSASTVTRWETRELVSVDLKTLCKIVDALNFPQTFFLAPPTPYVADDDLLFRAPKSTLKREKGYLREFARVVGELLHWIEAKRPLPPLLLPVLPSDTPAKEAAAIVRRALGQPADEPIRLLTHTVERAGVPVIRRAKQPTDDAPQEGSKQGSPKSRERHLGYTTWVGDFWDRPIIITRNVDSWERTRWTVAHEVGHTVLHRSGHIIASQGEAAEDAANRFASELLAPIDVIRGQLPATVTLFALIDLKMEWGISLGALIPHLYSNGLISRERRETLRSQLYARHNPETGTTYGLHEPGWSAQRPERPSMLRHWLERTLGTGEPESVAAISAMWPADLLREILAEQRSTRPTPAPAPDKGEKVVSLSARRVGRG
jgi:Zn-dependent peptidase ImmA (M78 family)/transcriptional regulator with XRE-family HTH domain